jgi:protein O-mannosyl-transferase
MPDTATASNSSSPDRTAQQTGCASRQEPPAWAAAAVLLSAIAATYGKALDAPLFFDDVFALVENKSIKSLWPLVGATQQPGPLNPPKDLPISARPLVNLSFAINYYFGGLDPVGYHLINVVIHFLSAMLLWSIVRRTLRLPYFASRFDAAAGWLALAVALLWALHPLQTEAVIYTTQRTELMMALFYLATLYCSLRYWSAFPVRLGEDRGEGEVEKTIHPHPALSRRERVRRTVWLTLAVLACLCGMASKEVMVSAPLVVLLFERTFIARSLKSALQRSWPHYVGLASTWLLLLGLCLGKPHGASAGFGLGISVYEWWLTQCPALLMYLKLAVWPWPLLINYQWPYLTSLSEAWFYVVPVLLLGIANLLLLWRNNPIGFLAAFAVAILAPTSIVPIPLELAAERRMYLPLTGIIVLFVVFAYLLLQAVSKKWLSGAQTEIGRSFPHAVIGAPVLLLAIVLGLVSAERLAAYENQIQIWQEVVQRQPRNLLAHNNLGNALAAARRLPEAIEELRATLAIKADYPEALNNIGVALTRTGSYAEATEHLRRAVQLKPDHGVAHNNLGYALLKLERPNEAVLELQAALALLPDDPVVLKNLGLALTESGRLPEALEALLASLKARPDYPPALNAMGVALIQMNRYPEAIEYLQHAVRERPNYAEAHNNLGNALTRTGRLPEAINELQAALTLQPEYPNALNNLGIALTQTGRLPDAVAAFEHAIRLKPSYADAHSNLGIALSRNKQVPRAIEEYQAALTIEPNHAGAHYNLGCALVSEGRAEESTAHFEEVVRLEPSIADAHSKLGDAMRQSGQIERSIEHYRASARLQPTSIPAYAKLAQALKAANRPEEAIATAQKAIEVARSSGQGAGVHEIEEWMARYQAELERNRNITPSAGSSSKR